MGYDYSYATQQGDGSVILAAAIIWLVFVLLMMAFSVVSYVLQSLGVYTIAKRRGIRYSWLSWIPVANLWIWGSLSDQYQYVVKGKVKSRRKVLLTLSIVTSALVAVMIGLYIATIVNVILNAQQLDYLTDAQTAQLLLPMLGIFVVMIPMFVVAITGTVFQYMALYDIYRSCDPSDSVLFLVLSILVNVTCPFFLFSCRNKDYGMPPRRDAIPPVENPQQPTWQSYDPNRE